MFHKYSQHAYNQQTLISSTRQAIQFSKCFMLHYNYSLAKGLLHMGLIRGLKK